MDAFLQDSRDLFLQTSGICTQSKEHSLQMQRSFKAPQAPAPTILTEANFGMHLPQLPRARCFQCFFALAIVRNLEALVHQRRDFVKMLRVLAWSFIHLANAVWPSKTHGAKAWAASGHGNRSKRSSAPMPCAEFLVEVRGDWKM